jgi:surface protein
MTSMFAYCYSLQSVPLFDTSGVTSMYKMFAYCYSLQSVPLFDTSGVTSMYQMFAHCYSLQSVPLFDTSGVTNMYQMFYACYSLQSVPLFDTSGVTNMDLMFYACHSLQVCNLQNQNISFDISDTNVKGLDLDELANSVKDMTGQTAPSVTVRTDQLTGANQLLWTDKNFTIVEV